MEIVQESAAVARSRRKLEEQAREEAPHFSSENLRRVKEVMADQISKGEGRLPVPGKEMGLWTRKGNGVDSPVSAKVEALMKRIMADTPPVA